MPSKVAFIKGEYSQTQIIQFTLNFRFFHLITLSHAFVLNETEIHMHRVHYRVSNTQKI